jgi:hypothetical protein
MKAPVYRITGQPPGKKAPQLDQLRWIRRILARVTMPTMVLACVLLIAFAHLYVVAAVFAALQVLSLASITRRINRAAREPS